MTLIYIVLNVAYSIQLGTTSPASYRTNRALTSALSSTNLFVTSELSQNITGQPHAAATNRSEATLLPMPTEMRVVIAFHAIHRMDLSSALTTRHLKPLRCVLRL